MEKPSQIGPRQHRHPPWLKVRAAFGEEVHELKQLLGGLKLHTVCQEARCPNMGECWRHGVATFMILGDVCTRGCRYCAVSKGKPLDLDAAEPGRVAEAVQVMGLRHVVITSVDRDDLEDGGAGTFAATMDAIRRRCPGCVVEVLIPDFKGSADSLQVVLKAQPDILGHNIETVPRLYPKVRGGGEYKRSLELLRRAKQWAPEVVTKTGMMLGLGEGRDEIRQVMRDLVEQGIRLLTLGQYLRPSRWHLPVVRYYYPQEFRYWKEVGEAMGFQHVESGPLVRSSYLADRQYAALQRKQSDVVAAQLALQHNDPPPGCE
ncbi:MAG: lipoyl synthase [Acidobacteria bacterium]|nr:lipoyl synthase [Acidobacteriota bacterium]